MLEVNFLFFVITFIFGLCSIIGYGNIFRYLFLKNHNSENYLDYNGFYGLGLLSLISLITSIFFSHNFIHNMLVHLFGFSSFIFFFKSNTKYFKKILIVALCVFSLLLISKTNEDFPYYHLPFTKYLIENKIIFGMGNIGHGYNYISSLFFLNSTFYFPKLEFYSYHFSTLYYLIFFNYFLINEMFFKKNNSIIFYLYLFAFTFFNISFNRLAEYGTDKAGQLLIIIIIIKLIDILCFDEKKAKLNRVIFLIPLLGLCISLKTYFLPYILLALAIIFVDKKFIINLKKIIFCKPFLFFISLLFVIYFHHFVSTGCLISPMYFTCFGQQLFSWARNIEEVKGLSTWLEIWSKAGAGPNYRAENLLLYIEDFNWVSNWLKKYFIPKFLDQIAILVSTYILLLVIFKKFEISKRKVTYNKKIFYFIYIIIIMIFLIWFNKHPALRYGGYPVFFLVLSIPISYFFSKLVDREYLNSKLKFFILFVFIIINTKNALRIHDEFFISKNEAINFPFFYLEKPLYIKKNFYEDFTIHSTTKRFCWTIPSPCGNFDNIFVTKKNGYFFINKIN